MKEKILVSRCLLGENVRYDGGNCLVNKSKLAKIEKNFEIIPICPEVLAGMSIPREPIELINNSIYNEKNEKLDDMFIPVFNYLKILIVKNKIKYALLKEFSPSCGVHEVYDGTFSGKTVSGMGLVTSFLKKEGVTVFSEYEMNQLIEVK